MAKIGEQQIIECSTCEANVSAKIIALKDGHEEWNTPSQVLFMECPSCKGPLLGYIEVESNADGVWDFGTPLRLWPKPKNLISRKLPESVRDSIEEANTCFNVRAYSAAVVMCGRALESICKEHSVKDWKLNNGLKELKDSGIIDGRLFEWGNELRKSRNIGAHANSIRITKEDARDILDFTIAIGEYVYVLSDKYASFKKRQSKTKILIE